MRVDRNGSLLAILSISLPKQLKTPRALDCLSEFLAERLRVTDTFGWQRDGRLGVLLPDTPPHGAELVAQEILDFINTQEHQAKIEISIYPVQDPLDLASRSRETDRKLVDDQPEVVAFQSSAECVDRLFATPLPKWKRLLDITGSSIGLLAASPLMAVLTVAVSTTSKGGAFYAQEREGLGGRRFKMYKFRSMLADSDGLKAKLRRHSVQDGPAFKMHRDPRVTKIGRLLRALSLDELPQLYNVLRGDMSLVGPRPLPVEESLACEPWQRQRLVVTPGITCIWQVSARNQVKFDEWMRMDLSYARRRSLGRDLRLLLDTCPSLLLSRGPR